MRAGNIPFAGKSANLSTNKSSLSDKYQILLQHDGNSTPELPRRYPSFTPQYPASTPPLPRKYPASTPLIPRSTPFLPRFYPDYPVLPRPYPDLPRFYPALPRFYPDLPRFYPGTTLVLPRAYPALPLPRTMRQNKLKSARKKWYFARM